MPNKLVCFGAVAIAIIALAGFRTNSQRVQDVRPKLTVLSSVKNLSGCGTGTTTTRQSNTASYELKIPKEQAVASSEKELLNQGYQRQEKEGRFVTFVRRDGWTDRAVMFGDFPYHGRSTCGVSLRIRKLMWYGLAVPSPFGM